LTSGPPVSTIIFFLDDVSSISTKAIAAMCAEVPRRRRVTGLQVFFHPKPQYQPSQTFLHKRSNNAWHWATISVGSRLGK
jgi:hypothetical protein